MTEDEIFESINHYYANKFSRKEVEELFIHYCVSLGKDAVTAMQFFSLIRTLGIELTYYGYIIDYYAKKLNIITITDRNNKFIKIYKHEEINNSPNASNRESCKECAPPVAEEIEDYDEY